MRTNRTGLYVSTSIRHRIAVNALARAPEPRLPTADWFFLNELHSTLEAQLSSETADKKADRFERLAERHVTEVAGSSPVGARGLLYVYDVAGTLRIYKAEKGIRIAELECGAGHWSSPIVVDRKIALPEGNSRRQAPANGVLNIWSLPDN